MVHPPRGRRIRRATVLMAALIVAGLALAAPATARSTIDPSTLTPPIPLTSNPVCGWSGGKVLCLTDRTFDVVDAETGIYCNDGQVLESSHRHVFGQRWYDADLNLVETRFLEEIEGYLFIPDAASVYWTGTDYGVQKLSVPGDRGTGVGTNSGANIHLYPDGGGSIALSGRTTEDFDTGDFHAVGNPVAFDFCMLFD